MNITMWWAISSEKRGEFDVVHQYAEENLYYIEHEEYPPHFLMWILVMTPFKLRSCFVPQSPSQ